MSLYKYTSRYRWDVYFFYTPFPASPNRNQWDIGNKTLLFQFLFGIQFGVWVGQYDKPRMWLI